LEGVEFFRLDANRKLDPERRSELGQFMTPSATSRLMASMFKADTPDNPTGEKLIFLAA
jgi:hypothetical protein